MTPRNSSHKLFDAIGLLVTGLLLVSSAYVTAVPIA
jgi:hypothetical protein